MKGYLRIFGEAVLLVMPWLDEINASIRVLSGLAGLVLIYYTIRKIRADLRLKALQTEQEQERLRILQNSDEL